ncbi:major facilitator superfamily domain-containing protein 4A-like [Haliotis asinina]|uniref:major facilitator superfamily domain-containing protein 4A-like n=1 Tax=Haliotis asinina TaxID=109174 RepID=UPI00353224D2
MEDKSSCLEMFALFFFTVTVGIPLGSFGPCLPDLQCLWEEDLKAVSSLFLILSIGCFLGLIFTNMLLTTLNGYVVLMLVAVIRGVSLVVFPFTGSLGFGGTALFVCGATLGISSVAAIHQSNLMWPTKAGPIHFVMTGVAVGSALAPILENPFLSDGVFTIMMTCRGNETFLPDSQSTDTPGNITSTEDLEPHGESYESSLQMNILRDTFASVGSYSFSKNMTVLVPMTDSLTKSNISNTDDSGLNSVSCAQFVTYIEYPFIIYGLLAIPVTVGLFICYKREASNSQSNPYTSLDKPQTPTYSFGQKYFIVHLLAYSTFVLVVSGCFSNLIASFGITCVLHIGLNTTSVMASVFWLFYTVGRFVPSKLPDSVTSVHLISACFVGMFVGTGILFLCISYGLVPLWISVAVLALFTGPLYTSLFTLAREYVPLSPGLITLLSMGGMIGLFIGPFLLGVLMHMFGPNMFVYVIAAVYFIHLILYMGTVISAQCAK